MILKKLENGIVISAVEIKSFDITIDSNNRALIEVILDHTPNSTAQYSQEPGDHHIYQVSDSNNNLIRLVHQ